jgi:DNA helicase-2/ATP-dependent DNA helicase PcrA
MNKLNDDQLIAVENIFGPLLVLAGPGTGKTELLASRVQNILQKTDTHPSNILCLTFTNSGTVAMRKRLTGKIGTDAYKVKISTFHGFCEDIIGEYSEIFQPKIQQKTLADDLQKALIFQETAQFKDWKYLSSLRAELGQMKNFFSALSGLKRENFSREKLLSIIPEEEKRLLDDPSNFYKRASTFNGKKYEVGDFKPVERKKIDKKVEKMYEFCDFWEHYEKLFSAKFYDFDDQINFVVNELKTNEELRCDLQERYLFIMIDEYQDTNNSQNEIVWQLTKEVDEPNIMVVGDDDQSIYRFQGASVANIAGFKDNFPDFKTVTLGKNYRSRQSILDASHNVIVNNGNRSKGENEQLVASHPKFLKENFPGKNIAQADFSSRPNEINFLAKTISQHLKDGVSPSEITIIVRSNKEISELSGVLPRFGIPVSIKLSSTIFENSAVRWIILMLEIFQNFKNDEQFIELCHAPFLGINPSLLARLSLARYKDKKSFIEFLIDELDDKSETKKENPLPKISQENFLSNEELKKFLNFLLVNHVDFHHCRPAILAEKILYKSGLANWLMAGKKFSDWQMVKKFITWIADQNQDKLSEILRFIDLHLELDISVEPDALPHDANSINIITGHKAKGLEFEIVFIPSLNDRNWGGTKNFGGIYLPPIVAEEFFDENEEERRLFFVALTRAKKQLYLSRTKFSSTGKDLSPSMFSAEISSDLVDFLPQEKTEESVHNFPEKNISIEEQDLKIEKNLLRNLVENFVWSASALNTYLQCPREFLYKNLLRFPRKPSNKANMMMGTALHSALERSIRVNDFSWEKLSQEFDHAMRGQNFSKEDFTKWHKEGLSILKEYYEHASANLTENFGTKLEFNLTPYNLTFQEIPIKGSIDKVTFLNKEQTTLKITDYKSGVPKRILFGETYWVQLVFYYLLFKSYGVQQNKIYKIENCELDFLRPNNSGKFKQEILEVGEKDIEVFTQKFMKAHKALLNLEFPLVPNEDKSNQSYAEIEFWQNFGQ